jgi:hypothetical protein
MISNEEALNCDATGGTDTTSIVNSLYSSLYQFLRLYGLLNVSVRVTTWLTAAGPWTVMGPNGNFTLDSWLITRL